MSESPVFHQGPARRRAVRVTFNDGDTITTEINGTEAEIRDYYKIGREFNIGLGPEDRMAKVVSLEFTDQAGAESSIQCPICLAEYHKHDAPAEFERVLKALTPAPDRVTDWERIREETRRQCEAAMKHGKAVNDSL